MATNNQIKAFILGEDLPLAVTTEIERQIDDPESDVRRIARDFSKLSRLVFDPSTPLPGDPAFRWPEEETKSEETY